MLPVLLHTSKSESSRLWELHGIGCPGCKEETELVGGGGGKIWPNCIAYMLMMLQAAPRR